ncbi:glycosyltransferase family 4 protein [Salinarimonas sp.]|uniref:glycosyltransferase family 4 protein n=1 Tax=Salinarimonas sp. TaxID=2766526 RepID=UPI00391CF9A8
MKVLVLGHSAGQIGGVSNFLRLMERRGLAGVTVEMMTVGPRDGEKGGLVRLIRLLKDYATFVQSMGKSYDCIHMNPSLDQRSFVRTLVFILICILFGRSFLVFFRGWDWKAHEHFFVRTTPGARVTQWMVGKASCFIVLAPAFEEALRRVYPTIPIHVISTMFDGEVMPKEGCAPLTSPQILFMSRFIPAKGGREAIDAFVQIRERFPDAVLRMAGDGPSRADWEAHARSYGARAEGVRFIGYVRGETKTAALAASNIFVMPTSHPEGMPNALMEAMGAGLIPIVTQAGGTFDAIKFGELGYMLTEPEPVQIEEAVTRIMSSPEASRQMSESIKVHAWKNFEASAVIDRIGTIYLSLAKPA